MPKITIRVANAEKLETQFLPELASGGLFIRSDKFLPLGAEVDIDLYLPSATEALPLRGRVTKVIDDDDARARKATGMSLAVDANSEPTRSRLEALYTAYKIPVKRAPTGDVTPGRPASNSSNGAYSTGHGAIPLPAPSSIGASIGAVALPGPGVRPPPASMGSLPDADDDLPSPKNSPPSIAPAIPSIAPAIAPALQTPPAVPVMKFDKPGGHGQNGASPKHHDEALYAGTAPPPPLDEPVDDRTPVRPLPFPFQRNAGSPPPPPAVPGFSALTHQKEAAATPPPPPAAAFDTSKLDARIKELESAESKARADARKASSEKEALEAKHAEATKRLNDEIAALQRKPAGGKRSNPLPAALLGLALGAGATFAYFTFMVPPAETKPTPDNTIAAVDTGSTTPPDNNAAGSKTPDETATANNNGTGGTLIAAVDAGSGSGVVPDAALTGGTTVKDAGSVAVADTAIAETAVKDAGSTMIAQVDVGGSRTPEVKPVDMKVETPVVNPENTEDELPPLAKVEARPVVDKKPIAKKPQDLPIGENAGVLNLRADLPATVYVNGKKVGNAPALGVKANPGKVTVRFDCVVEDVRVKGKNRTVNLAAKGTANVDFSCIE